MKSAAQAWRRWRRGTSWLVFVVVLAGHTLSVNKTPWDSRWSLPTALSIVTEGNTDLSEYEELLARNDDYMIKRVDGRPYSFFPLGASLWAVPVIAVVEGGLRTFAHRSFRDELLAGRGSDVEEFCASLAVAVAAVAVWQLAAECGLGPLAAAIATLLFAFGTSAWSTASRALWQHGPSLAALAWALLLLVRGRRRPRLVTLAALPLALSFVARPSNAVAVVAFTTYVAVRHRDRLAGFVAIGLAVAAALVAYDLHVYGSLLTTYLQPGVLVHGTPLGEVLLGNLVSPARGVLVYTPFVLLCPWGLRLWWRDAAWRGLAATVAAIVALHWLVISQIGSTLGDSVSWWAGHCYGPRFFTDMSAYLVFLLFPILRSDWGSRTSRHAVWVALAVLATVSVGIHAVGANLEPALRWNRVPANIDEHPERLWDWRDPQFLRWRSPPDNAQP